jgi:hypothetical protein
MPRRQAATVRRREAKAAALLQRVCGISGERAMIARTHAYFHQIGVTDAVQRHDDGPVYDWLVALFGLQGVSDGVAWSYWTSGGGITEAAVTAGLAQASCPKLASFWSFERCGYRKRQWRCGEPDHREACPLPRHDLRNGRLNQSAYSLRLFLRDVCDNDLVGWIDRQLAGVDRSPDADFSERLGRAVIAPFTGVFGVQDKLVSMAFSELLLAADPSRALWVTAGAGMIAVDTLVHNWLHRTGILRALNCEHAYGPGCYAADGCASVVRRLSSLIDARRFNAAYPRDFPRFVQHAIWRFCAVGEVNQCNGVQIDDRLACADDSCPVGQLCARAPLRPNS